jgi:DNA repair exonuclease SbcCD nuclease subunit
MVKILATADWQMDMVGGGLNPEARMYLSAARVETIEKILELANEEDVDVILAAGDLFEYPSPTPEVINAVASVLQRSEIPIHAIPGNHDLYGKSSVWNTPVFREIQHFHLHHKQTKTEIAEGFTLHSIPVTSKYDMQQQDEHLEDVSDEDGVHIVMAHAHDVAVGTFGAHEDGVKLPIDSAKVIGKGYSLLILGHWHSWNEVQENRVLYPGTHEQTKFGERDAGYVAIIDVPGDGSEPQIVQKRVGKIQWLEAKERTENDEGEPAFNCSGKELPDDLIEYVRQHAANGVDFLKVQLTGEVDVTALAGAIPDAKAVCGTLVRHFDVSTDELTTVIDVEAMTNNVELPMGLREIQSSILTDLKNAQGNEEMTNNLMDELTALYRACRSAGIIED